MKHTPAQAFANFASVQGGAILAGFISSTGGSPDSLGLASFAKTAADTSIFLSNAGRNMSLGTVTVAEKKTDAAQSEPGRPAPGKPLMNYTKPNLNG